MRAATQADATEAALPDLAAVSRLGAAIAKRLAPGDVVALSGDLGAGKTTLARDILRARGHAGEVPSPTFTLIQDYDLPGLAIAHVDLYRVKNAAELTELGLDDALAAGAALIEWPQIAQDWLPPETLTVALTTEPRCATLCGGGHWAVELDAIAREAA